MLFVVMRHKEITLDPLDKKTLTAQLADNIRRMIMCGVWKIDDVLPGIHELAAQCHTSERVPRAALAQLASEGWIRPVRGVGSVVVDRFGMFREEGRVLVYMRGTGWSYYNANIAAALESSIRSAGYGVTTIVAGERSEAAVCRRLATLLAERWSLVLLVGGATPARQLVLDSGWPFALVGDGSVPPPCNARTCIGRIDVRTDRCLPDFVRACIARKVKRVVQFKYTDGPMDVARLLGQAGCDVDTVVIPRRDTQEEVSRRGFVAMRQFLARKGKRQSLPDLILFTDDYLAKGSLLALAMAGVRVPHDVFVVTHANKGFGPVWETALTRIEMDPVAHGREIAKVITEYLESGCFPSGLVLGSVWNPGETF